MTFAPLTPDVVAFIREHEGCPPAPYWPKGASGVTIGLGYDLRHHVPGDVAADWGRWLKPDEVRQLQAACGHGGEEARWHAQNCRNVRITFEAALDVFVRKSAPKYQVLTLQAFPGLERLPAAVQWALFSLVYNRGGSVGDGSGDTDTDRGPDRREEMRIIRRAVADGNAPMIADALEQMARLWDGGTTDDDGLVKRRKAEAALVRSCIPKAS